MTRLQKSNGDKGNLPSHNQLCKRVGKDNCCICTIGNLTPVILKQRTLKKSNSRFQFKYKVQSLFVKFDTKFISNITLLSKLLQIRRFEEQHLIKYFLRKLFKFQEFQVKRFWCYCFTLYILSILIDFDIFVYTLLTRLVL